MRTATYSTTLASTGHFWKTPVDVRQFRLLQGFRAAIAIFLVSFLARTIDLGISTALLIAFAILGVYLSGLFLKRGKTARWVFVAHLALVVGFWFFSSVIEVLVAPGTSVVATRDFMVFRYADQATLLFLAYLASLLTTWLFWTRRNFLTGEALLLGFVFVWLLSGHRNYHLDAPKTISSIAWSVGLAPQHLLLALGLGFSIFVGAYFTLAHERPILFSQLPVKTYSRQRRLFVFLFPSVLLMLLLAFATFINSTYSKNLSRASNGVGTEGKKEGESPLGFHSAIGQTRQPAALVRLEGDYEENPWLPMMYLREGALSSFSGRELVVASNQFDRDIPRVAPGEPYVTLDQPEGTGRKQVTQSIYLLSQHTAPFGLDTPTAIRLIKNPDEKRFNVAYQVDSQAPTTKVQDLTNALVGSTIWDEATRQHYLRAPGSQSRKSLEGVSYSSDQPVLDEFGEDLRYRLLAEELTRDLPTPVLKAAALVDYLSKESIYTRKPGHAATAAGDPVAPYLFSKEKRGYCVHFAHAAVYMMRLIGVPARIATGYLTDLTYAKDGHILLHLGDRHAWPEIYIEGEGWLVLDVTPSQAENEQVIVPDEKLLEELMNQIDPGQALITPPPPAPQDPVEKSALEQLVTQKNTIGLLATVLLGYLLVKLYVREGWRLARNPQRRIRLAYTAFAAHAADLGLSRNLGETRLEYQARLRGQWGIDAGALTQALEQTCYAPEDRVDGSTLTHAVATVRSSIRQAKLGMRRIFCFISPLSLSKWRRL